MNKDKREFQIAAAIVKKLRSNGFEAFFAGGFIRDYLMGGVCSDIDIATAAKPTDVLAIFSHVIGVGEHFGVMLVISEGMQFEVATFRSDGESKDGRHPKSITFSDAKTDALRRDFTINGMFYDPDKGEIIDYVNGQEGIKNKIIQTIGDPNLRFTEDYLRLMRAVRFAARFEFDIEKETFEAIKKHSKFITKISNERIFQELDKMLIDKNRVKAITLLSEAGLLQEILPEVEALKGVEQPPEYHPEGDVFVHTLLVLKELKNPTSVAAWSALLHDIGKPATMRVLDRIRFNNHHRVGARMCEKVLGRFKCSNNLKYDICECVDNHMNWMNVTKMKLSTLKRFLSRETLSDELNLHQADCLASHGSIDNYDFVMEKLETFEKETIKPDPFVTGKDLIALGIKPGPIFGKVLTEIYDLQLEEKVLSRKEALLWLSKNYKIKES